MLHCTTTPIQVTGLPPDKMMEMATNTRNMFMIWHACVCAASRAGGVGGVGDVDDRCDVGDRCDGGAGRYGGVSPMGRGRGTAPRFDKQALITFSRYVRATL